MKILITGAAGFIGYHLVKRIMQNGGSEVVGLDSLNDYYDPALKLARLAELGIDKKQLAPGKKLESSRYAGFCFVQEQLESRGFLQRLFREYSFDVVVNLAAQAGVRYSLENPYSYVESNVMGFLNLLEASRQHGVGHLVFASSSSVYGLNREMPFSPSDPVDHPVSLYAATKRSNELMAHTYSHLYGLPATGLRFFTVYGPYGRPDMAYFSFTNKIYEGKTIKVFNHGQMQRDFTYIDDIVEGMFRLLDKPPKPREETLEILGRPDMSTAPFSIYNIGNNRPVQLMDFIRIIEKSLGKKAQIELLPMQPGDVEETFADIEGLRKLVGFNPSTPLEEGLPRFIDWYTSFYG
jgi:UDP-glucuronate 4-epimerase